MLEEFINSSKACVHVLGDARRHSTLFDFDGFCILDGGFAEKATGFMAHVRNISGVLLSAPTQGNLGTVTALLEKNQTLPVYLNAKTLLGSKSGSSGEQVMQIQEANSKLLRFKTPVFLSTYQPYILHQSDCKGVLSLYVLAGDDREITKSLVSGSEAMVERAAAENGTIGVLLWQPAQADSKVVRVLISGTSSTYRIQQSLDRASKHLPFLNAAVVKSKDAFSNIPVPTTAAPLVYIGARGLTRMTPSPSASRPAFTTSRSAFRAAAKKPTSPSRTSRIYLRADSAAENIALGKKSCSDFKPETRAKEVTKKFTSAIRSVPMASTRSTAETNRVQKKANGKTQGAVTAKHGPPATARKAPVGKASDKSVKKTPSSEAVAAAMTADLIKKSRAQFSNSTIVLSDSDEGDSEVLGFVLVAPKREPPEVNKLVVEKEVPTKMPESTPVEPKEEKPEESPPTKPELELEPVIRDSPNTGNAGPIPADHVVAVDQADIISTDDALFPDAVPDGLSMSIVPDVIASLIARLDKKELVIPKLEALSISNGHNCPGVIENGSPVQHAEHNPANENLEARASEGNKSDEPHSETLHMPERRGVPVTKFTEFRRPYYFDLATMPHNEDHKLTGTPENIREFVAKVRTRNLILPSKDISDEQLNAILTGKRVWSEKTHPCNIVPTHSSAALTAFHTKNEEELSGTSTSFAVPVEKSIKMFSTTDGVVGYQCVTLPLHE